MHKAPAAPDWMSTKAPLAFNRIVERMASVGDWRPEYQALAEAAAVSCSIYHQLAEAGMPADEELAAALMTLQAVKWFDDSHPHKGEIGDRGYDPQILEVCAADSVGFAH